jgi:hypothetical protein
VTVNRTLHEDIAAAPALRRLGATVAQLLTTPRPDFDAVSRTLIDAGELASAVLDELHPHADDLHPAAALWTAPVTLLARATDAAWRADGDTCAAALQTAMSAIDACARSYVPREVTRRPSDGFAYSALGPQLYAEAAREWDGAPKGARVVCLGLRAFGVTPAAAAAAGLTSRGVNATMMTLRTRSSAAALSVVLTPRLRRAIQEWADVTFLVVDDDPALSESSIACVATALSDLGVEDRRIVLMPAHRPTVSAADGVSAPTRWEQHAIVTSDFEHAWMASGRLASSFAGKLLVEGGATS